MALTLLLTFVCIAGVFLMLFAATAFIQDKKFFGTAPKDVQERVQVHEERFPGMHVLGYVLCIVAIAMIIGSVVIAVWDRMKNDYGFLPFFIRFLIMLEGYKIWELTATLSEWLGSACMPITCGAFLLTAPALFLLAADIWRGKTFLRRSALFFIPAVPAAVIMLVAMLIPSSPFSYGFYTFCMNGGMLVWFGYLFAVNNLKG